MLQLSENGFKENVSALIEGVLGKPGERECKLGTLGEAKLGDGLSAVFGMASLAAIIDDKKAVIYLPTDTDGAEHSHAHKAYSTLVEDFGYSFEYLKTIDRSQWMAVETDDVASFLKERGIHEKIKAVLKEGVVGGSVAYYDGAKNQEDQNIYVEGTTTNMRMKHYAEHSPV